MNPVTKHNALRGSRKTNQGASQFQFCCFSSSVVHSIRMWLSLVFGSFRFKLSTQLRLLEVTSTQFSFDLIDFNGSSRLVELDTPISSTYYNFTLPFQTLTAFQRQTAVTILVYFEFCFYFNLSFSCSGLAGGVSRLKNTGTI